MWPRGESKLDSARAAEEDGGGAKIAHFDGLWSGYLGPGPKTIIPAKAGAKLSSPLVANQDPETIFRLLKKHIESVAPPTVKVEVKLLTKGKPALIPVVLPEMQAAARAYVKSLGTQAGLHPRRWQHPIVADIGDMMKFLW